MIPPRTAPRIAISDFRIPRPKNANTRPTTMRTPAIAQMRVGGRKSRNAMRQTESFCWEYKNPSKADPARGEPRVVFIADQLFYEAPTPSPRHGGGNEVHNGTGAKDDLDVPAGGLRIRDRLALERSRHERAELGGDQHERSRRYSEVGDIRRDGGRPDGRDGGPDHSRGPPRTEGILDECVIGRYRAKPFYRPQRIVCGP